MRLFISFICLFVSIMAFGKETQVVVRAKARDAKFIGSSLGGAYVKIYNQLTGALMSQGITSGSTGNTQLIMSTPYERGASICTDETAKFHATVDIEEPTFIYDSDNFSNE